MVAANNTNDLPTSSPEAQGIDSAQLNMALKEIQKSGTPIDSILIMRNGYVVLDSYFYPYQPNTLHDLRSVTKSVTSTMLGISIEQGKLKSLDQPMRPFFAEQLKGDIDPRKAAITLGNLVDMHSGIAWYEIPYNSQSSIYQMVNSADWNQYVLQQAMDDEPGRTFNYNGGNMNLLSAVIEKAWNMPMQEVAALQLFKPLGIQNFYWQKDPSGHTIGEANLALAPHDLAKLGQFWLQDGVWQGQRLLPAGWIKNLFEDTRSAQSAGYRRGFWVDLSQKHVQALGRHGQFVLVDPAQQLVIVMTSKIADQDFNERTLNQLHQLAKNKPPLPVNAIALAELSETIQAIALPDSDAKNTLELGSNWYAKTWRFSNKPWGIEAISLKLDPQDAGSLIWEVDSINGKTSWPVGLDGAYRRQADARFHNLNLYAKARWKNTNTLEIKTQYAEGAISRHYSFKFNKNNVELSYADNESSSGQATGLLVKP
ncbi:serine hydrolase [Deefgea sp. CFH1-16]|uniref:serine hydrolase domain-containing protein n=1 Tax=Deefgea sp. CFH1-16 TaxID=2675457 RepID=UPI0015F588A3|nr:serine hydrolase [Deefgea sp. CFH1-16]